MTYYVNADSFGAEIPANWEEIAAYLNELTDERGIAEDHDACNDLWEEYWRGELDGAPEAKNDVTIYMMHEEPLTSRGEIGEGKPTFDKNEAIREAEMQWAHMTDREKKNYHVYVGIHKVTVPVDDTRSAEQIYHDMLEDDTWPADHDVIELEKIYQVEFKAGPGKHFDGDVNFMMADIGEVHLYAECEWKEGQEEDAGYCTLVQTIVADARRMGFPVESLSFYYDGFEDKLSDDARTACKVWSDSYKE